MSWQRPAGRPPLTLVILTAWLGACDAGANAGEAMSDAVGRAMALPTYEPDPAWPPPLPNGWVWGVVTSVDVDEDDDVWVLHRPRNAEGGTPAPAVVEFAPDGTFLQAWGGPGQAYDWPDTEHGIYVDDEENVWITGINPRAGNQVSDRSDDMILKFTADGTFLLQLGGFDTSGGNADTESPQQAADVAVHEGEAFIADGYGNTRVWVVDAETGEHQRTWGAFGNEPIDDPELPEPAASGPGPDQFDIVHGVAVSSDGLVYVADRTFRRIQVFTSDGRYVTQGFVARDEPPRATVSRIAFSADPEQRRLYASDFGGGIVWILDRETLEVVGRFGERGTEVGQFGNLHHIAVDSRNDVYSAEVGEIGGLQKWRATLGPAVTNPYDAIDGWLTPFDEGFTFGGNVGIHPDTPDRIFVLQRGQTRLPSRVPAGYEGFAASIGMSPQAGEGRVWENVIFVVDRDGNMIETWDHWDYLFQGSEGPGPHRIRISPFDPERRVWVIHESAHQIFVFTNDGSELLLTLGEKNVTANDETHFGRPQDVAFMPDGRVLVGDGLTNKRIVILDSEGNYLSQFGEEGTGPGQFESVHAVTTGPDGLIVVVDRDAGEVELFRETGRATAYHPTIESVAVWGGFELTLDAIVSGEHVWVSDLGRPKIVKLDMEGNRLLTWYWPSQGPDRFREMHTFMVDSEGNLYGSDNQLGRSQKLMPIPGAVPTHLIGIPFGHGQ